MHALTRRTRFDKPSEHEHCPLYTKLCISTMSQRKRGTQIVYQACQSEVVQSTGHVSTLAAQLVLLVRAGHSMPPHDAAHTHTYFVQLRRSAIRQPLEKQKKKATSSGDASGSVFCARGSAGQATSLPWTNLYVKMHKCAYACMCMRGVCTAHLPCIPR